MAHLSDDFLKANELPPNFHSHVKESQDEIEQAVIDELDIGRKIITIVAPAGMGKSTMLLRISYQLAYRHNIDLITRQDYYGGEDELSTIVSVSEMEFVDPLDLEMLPSFPIPIFFELRIAFENIDQFKNSLLTRIKELTGNKEIRTLESLFAIPGSQWIILLDGIDEIRNRQDAAPKLRTWVNQLPDNVQVVLTSRPGYVMSKQGVLSRVIEIDQLKPEEIRSLLEGKIRANCDQKGIPFPTKKTLDDLSNLTELSGFLFNQRAIDGLIELWLPESNSALNPTIDRVSENVIVQDVIPYEINLGEINLAAREELTSRIHEELTSDVDLYHHKDTPVQESLVENIESGKEKSEEEVPGDEASKDDKSGDIERETEEQDAFSLPSLAGMIRYVVEYLYNKEKSRRADWGKREENAVNTARNELAYVAWKENWEITEFNSFTYTRRHLIKSDSLACNEDIGFLKSSNVRKHRFSSLLLHKYFIVDYGFDLDRVDVVKGLKRRDLQSDSTRTVINLLDQLFLDQGQPSLSSTLGE